MTHTFKLASLSKLLHSRVKAPAQKHTKPKDINPEREIDEWAMSPQDALRVPYSGHK